MSADPTRVASAFAKKAAMSRVAGEVRFIKDRSGDKSEWGWGPTGPSERHIQEDFVFNARELKPLAKTLRSALMALGHATSSYNRLVKVKSRNVSPDGSLGGKGYIQTIPDMRRQLMNCVEALSAFTDTIYDEMHAPHWNPSEDTLDARDRDEVKEIIEDAEEIKEDPEGWAEEQEEDMDDENEDDLDSSGTKMARRMKKSRNPPLHNAALADKAVSEAYTYLVDLKLGFDSWEEIPKSAQPLYKEIMGAMDACRKAGDKTYQVRMMVQRKRYGSDQIDTRRMKVAAVRHAAEGTLYYGHKSRHGSFFLTSFALGLPVDPQKFVKKLDVEMQRQTGGLTNVRLHEVKDSSQSGFPIVTVWWGGDTGSEDPNETQLGDDWYVEESATAALRAAGKKMGFRNFEDMRHSAYVDKAASSHRVLARYTGRLP